MEAPLQDEMPFAVIYGELVARPPQDLYIPPEAMEVFLDAFEGPLDLLLYLIRKQNLDILDIPVAQITEQYMEYVELMKEARLDLAAEYMVMAAMLAEIKSRMLLPRPVDEDDEEDDPRAQLVRRLQEYERYRQAAMDIEDRPRVGRNIFIGSIAFDYSKMPEVAPKVALPDLLDAFKGVLQRAKQFRHLQLSREILSVRERMTMILGKVKAAAFTRFEAFFDVSEGRMGVVVTFVALLELLKDESIVLVQNELYGPIHIKAVD
ncbi:MAG TPA: segregation/condensation protein A [Acidiferrobacteraceae bacterium]|nr:segregation/condensation protein A [Acidiferrobacteraceae bacterium]